jgi:single-strand DNA-binding protein
MTKFINRTTIYGIVDNKPEIRQTQAGKELANFTVYTADIYKDQEYKDWHKIVCYSAHLIEEIKFLQKGDEVYLEGAIKTRKYTDKTNTDRYITEIVLKGIEGKIIIPTSKSNAVESTKEIEQDTFNDSIPF